ncbi:branched-chain amino acid ABC transporter substrate-binding protein [Acidisoma cellulosilytica]|uniref:Branched-chain amino acid ABC transporter substrate-binding protein n=1 Tax=Acidisoma cellulosilyticum TaxID=2802395 RepID=A0A964E3R1_9PROT|nr:branched-chain amino acid ABC transporter substrate-binding protein [Acidisoma cellulosilyticum]MCB8880694.1 branched-chain amino acid ABC transporter substrate-binding protein [Acidisoma cellulosilyticum]
MIKPLLYAGLPLLMTIGGSAAFADTIKFGVPVPLSGPYASAGIDIANAAKLAAAKINAAGGVLGKQIEIVAEDDTCDAQTGVQAAQKLIDGGIAIATGSYCSGAALPELVAFHRAGIPYVLDAATNPKLTSMGFDDVFRTIGRDDEQGPFAGAYISGYLHAKKAAVIDDNTTYSKGLADNTVAALKKDGVDVVYYDAITPGQMDYSAVLSHVSSLSPDVIYYTGYFSEAGLLAKEAAALHVTAKMMGGDATNDTTLIKTAGPAAEGWTATTAPLPQFLSGAKDFVTDFTKAYNTAPGPYSAYEYDAVSVAAKAIADAGSTDPKAITAALHKIANYQGLTGSITFNSVGDRTIASYITVVVKDGAFAPGMKLDASGAWVPVQQ